MHLCNVMMPIVFFSGESWCPDCVVARPVVEGAIDSSGRDDLVYLYVGVGQREFWKDPKCVFRTDQRTKLTSVPTLVKWGTQQRLVEEQCAKRDLVDMILEEE